MDFPLKEQTVSVIYGDIFILIDMWVHQMQTPLLYKVLKTVTQPHSHPLPSLIKPVSHWDWKENTMIQQ